MQSPGPKRGKRCFVPRSEWHRDQVRPPPAEIAEREAQIGRYARPRAGASGSGRAPGPSTVGVPPSPLDKPLPLAARISHPPPVRASAKHGGGFGVLALIGLVILGGTLGGLVVREEMGKDAEDKAEEWVPLTSGCTGSMWPTIGCHTELKGYPPPPAPMAKGTIISYRAIACPPLLTRIFEARPGPLPTHVAHRIVAVRTVDGEVSYLPRGDANDRADECWIPHDMVEYVVVPMSPK